MEKMNSDRIKFMRFITVPGSPSVDFEQIQIQNIVYSYWKNYWQSLLSEINPGEKVNSEHFFDQDSIGAILDGGRVVAMQALKYYDLRCGLRDHSVFSQFTNDFWKHLEAKGIKRVFTFRWFRVDDEYSPKNTGINFPAIICELGHRLFDEKSASDIAFVGHSRTDIAACNIAKKFGWYEVGERQMVHGVPCAQLVMTGLRKKYKDPEVNQISDGFWAKREDFTNEVQYRRAKAA